jgi:DNA-binding protein Alba
MSAPTVLVGRKPVWSYVIACYRALQQNGSVEVKARGRAIPKAIGAVQVLREGLVKGLEVERVDIGSSAFRGRTEGKSGSALSRSGFPFPRRSRRGPLNAQPHLPKDLPPDRSPLLLDPFIYVLGDLQPLMTHYGNRELR